MASDTNRSNFIDEEQSSIGLPSLQTPAVMELQATLTSNQLATNFRLPIISSGMAVCQNDSQNLGMRNTYDYSFIIAKDKNCIPTKGEMHKVRSERVSNTEVHCSLPLESGHVTFPAHQCMTTFVLLTRKVHPSIDVLSFHWGFIPYAQAGLMESLTT